VPLEGGAVAEPVDVHGHEGHGPRADRQEGPHAHFVAVAPGGRHVLVVDLGTDEIRRYAVTDAGVEPAGVAATLPPGTGPRHLAFAAGHAYVAGELDVRVHVLAWDEQTATGAWVGAVPAVVGAAPDDVLPSHLAVDGADVVVTVRGADVVTRYAIGADGGLTDGRSTPLGGGWPRHFAVAGGWTVVALERGHELVTVDRDGRVAARLDLPSPACVLPVR
jgi:6-phosphogluconolactonase (cycloisomerase 2 family)